jgi:hypothetical protein
MKKLIGGYRLPNLRTITNLDQVGCCVRTHSIAPTFIKWWLRSAP